MDGNEFKIIPVAIAVILDGGGRVVISRRTGEQTLAGYWEFPGGKIEAGESAFEAAVREAREEVGMEVVAEWEWGGLVHEAEGVRVEISVVVCRARGGDEPRAVAVAEARWVEARELGGYRMPPANGRLVGWLVEAGGAE